MSDVQTTSQVKDTFGMICSSLCLAHCLLLPMLLATGTLGTVGALLASENTHLLLLLPVVLLALLSFPSGYKQHASHLPGIFAVVGLAGLLLALVMGEAFETPLTTLGALLLIAAHVQNRRELKRVASDG